jgi:hypothetical protein
MTNRESDLGARAIVARPALRENWRFAAWRFVLAGFGAVALAGCASVSNTLSPQEVAGLKLTGVAVTFTPEAAVQWEDGQRLYAASKGVSYPQIGQPVDAAEEKAYLRNALTPKLKAAALGTACSARPYRRSWMRMARRRPTASSTSSPANMANGSRSSRREVMVDKRRAFAAETAAAVTAVAAIGELDYRLRHSSRDLH